MPYQRREGGIAAAILDEYPPASGGGQAQVKGGRMPRERCQEPPSGEHLGNEGSVYQREVTLEGLLLASVGGLPCRFCRDRSGYGAGPQREANAFARPRLQQAGRISRD